MPSYSKGEAFLIFLFSWRLVDIVVVLKLLDGLVKSSYLGIHLLKLKSKKIIDITYTPDFVFTYKGFLVIIEAKGMENDRFYLKKKMFRKWLEDNHPKSIYFEIYTKKQLLQAINIIKDLSQKSKEA